MNNITIVERKQPEGLPKTSIGIEVTGENGATSTPANLHAGRRRLIGFGSAL